MTITRIFLFGGIVALSALTASGQKETPVLPFDTTTGKITYTEVVRVDSSLTKSELYSRASGWLAEISRSTKGKLRWADRNNGKIICNALMQAYCKNGWGANEECGNIRYTISIFLKDGRYKYEITDFYHTGQTAGATTIPDYGPCEKMINTADKAGGISMQKTYNQILNDMDNNIRKLIGDLKSVMAKKPTPKKDDW